MFSKLKDTITSIQDFDEISTERKVVLQPLIDYIKSKYSRGMPINLNFICTHNSRRSHLAQIWAQCAAFYYSIPNVNSYSGGTEETALFPKVAEILGNQGFEVRILSSTENPIYTIMIDENSHPIIGFSKKFDHAYNPVSNFVAVMTCSQADEGCPFIAGAEIRIPITYEDPKISDKTTLQDEVYTTRSLQIATEMFYVFSKIAASD